jgi:H+/Cl- antiporter ClcA
MLKRVTEGTVLFMSILKWVVLATIVGVIVGLSTTLFLNWLNWSIEQCNHYSYYFLLLPVAFFLSALMVKYLAPDAEGHGTEKVIEAVHKHSGKIKAMVVPVKLAATIVTLAFGGSAGKEGPCAQIGGGLSSLFADLLRFKDSDRKKLVICGISAGFASVFGTPIAGAIFGVEVLFVGSLLYDVLLPSFIAGITSYQISSSFGIRYFHHTIDFVPVFSESFFAKVVLAGIFFGVCSFLFVEILNLGGKISKKINIWVPYKALMAGSVLMGLSFIFSKHFLGLGLSEIELYLKGGNIAWYAAVVKSVFTSITLNFGGSGGIVTPIFFVGAASGAVFAEIMGLDMATFAAIGLVSLVAGATNTPIAASIMAVELFGPKVAPYAAVACVISFLMTGHRSVYPSQVLAIRKSPSIEVEIGKEVEDIKTKFKPGRRRFYITRGLRIIRRMRPNQRKKDDSHEHPTSEKK